MRQRHHHQNPKGTEQSTEPARAKEDNQDVPPKGDGKKIGSTAPTKETSKLLKAQNADLTLITIPDRPKTMIVIDSEEHHPTKLMEPMLAPTWPQIAAESTRISTQEQSPSIDGTYQL